VTALATPRSVIVEVPFGVVFAAVNVSVLDALPATLTCEGANVAFIPAGSCSALSAMTADVPVSVVSMATVTELPCETVAVPDSGAIVNAPTVTETGTAAVIDPSEFAP